MIEYKRELQTEMVQEKGFLVKVIGVGGAGSNVEDQIALDGMDDAELICANTDIRTLKTSTAHVKIHIGKQLTRGLGAGGDPELGILAAEEAEIQIREAVKGQDIVFICVGLGGGTGSGAAPIISRIAKDEGAFVVVFATMPFSFEGRRRIEQAETALQLLERSADALITFENDRMGELVLPKEGIQQAFANADKIISQSVRAITNVVTQPGLIQIGMDDLLTALKNPTSRCLFGYGAATGKNRAQEALKIALRSPLLDRGQLLERSRNAVVHVVGGPSMSLYEVELLMNDMSRYVGPKTQILFGAAVDEKLDDTLSVTIISSLTLEELREHASKVVEIQTDEPEEIEAEADTMPAESTAKEIAETGREVEVQEEEPVAARVQTPSPLVADRKEEELAEAAPRQDNADADEADEHDVRDRPSEGPAASVRETVPPRQRDNNGGADEDEDDDEIERKQREAFARKREELRRREAAGSGTESPEIPAAEPERPAVPRREEQETAAAAAAPPPKERPEVPPSAPSPAPSAVDIMAQRKRAQEELEKKRAELEKLLKLEDQANTQRVHPEKLAEANQTIIRARPPAGFQQAESPVREEPTPRKAPAPIPAGKDLEPTQPFAPPAAPRDRRPAPNPAPSVTKPPAVKSMAPAKLELTTDRPAELPIQPVMGKKKSSGPSQGELPLDPLRGGRFEKAPPTVIDGENYDVPTFFRKRGKKG